MKASLSERLRSSIPTIMSMWEKRVKKQVSTAQHLEAPVLRNSLPDYLAQLADALSMTIERTPERKSEDREASLKTGLRHAGNRSECLSYTIDQLIFEYHLLRQVIFEVLEQKEPLSRTEREVILCSVEQAVNDAATEFSNRLNGQTHDLKTALMELDAFSYSVSHDLRAPLRSMDGFSDLLLEKHSDVLDEEAKGYLERIRNNSQKMARLIDDLLVLSRVGRTELIREDVDVTFIANHIVKRMKLVDPDRKIEVEISDHCKAQADLGLMRILMENLLSNAWKYTSKVKDAKISVSCEPGAMGTIYSVKDNGVGFEMVHATQLFKAFHRLHSVKEYPGTGIGLATVKRIVDRHGGRIWVESGPDKGAVFKFTLGGANDK